MVPTQLPPEARLVMETSISGFVGVPSLMWGKGSTPWTRKKSEWADPLESFEVF